MAGLVVCPERVPPSKWLVEVWGGDSEFENIGDPEATLRATGFELTSRTPCAGPNRGPVQGSAGTRRCR